MPVPAALVLASMLALCPATFGQAPAAKPTAPAAPAVDLPTGESLFAKHVAAVGGIEVLRAQKTALIKARISRSDGPTGLLTIWRQAPDKMYRIIDFPGQVTIETWCDGESAWMRDSNKGVARVTGEFLDETKLDSHFIGDADFQTRYKELKTTEKLTFADRPAYAVAATTAGGRSRTLYFDAEKSFLIGMKLPLAGDVKFMTITLAEYKQYGSTWQPTVVTEEAGPSKTITRVSQLEIDLPADKMTSVEPPDEIKNLKK